MTLTFKKAKLALAMSAIVAAGSAQAVNLTPDGLGDAAIFQYYTTATNGAAGQPWRTFIRVVNTSNEAVLAKVRFREAANSREVLDFMILLSPNDMWSGWADPNAYTDPATSVRHAGLKTNDTSCLIPANFSNNPMAGTFVRDTNIGVNGKYALFKADAFEGTYDDKARKQTVDANGLGTGTFVGLSSAERMAEGHLEVIAVASFPPTSKIALAATHGDNGLPASCISASNQINDLYTAIVANGTDSTDPGLIATIDQSDLPRSTGNVLATNAYLINVASGQGAGYDPVTLANFRVDPATNIDSMNDALVMIKEAMETESKPNLDSATPVSAMLSEDGTTVVTDTWTPGRNNVHLPVSPTPLTGGVDAVSALLTRSSVINEWAASPSAGIITDYFTQWVTTFPTKHFYVDFGADSTGGDDIAPTLVGTSATLAAAPFAFNFTGSGDSDGDLTNVEGTSCEAVNLSMYNREEAAPDFTSPGPYIQTALCHETNVITFNQAYRPMGLTSTFNTVIDSRDFPNDRDDNNPSERGWAQIDFAGSNAMSGLVGPTNTYRGLPVAGFMLSVYNTRAGAVNNHTTVNSHSYKRNIGN